MKTVMVFLFALLLSTTLYAGGLARGQQLTVDDMYPVLVNGKWGFIDRTGKFIWKPRK